MRSICGAVAILALLLVTITTDRLVNAESVTITTFAKEECSGAVRHNQTSPTEQCLTEENSNSSVILSCDRTDSHVSTHVTYYTDASCTTIRSEAHPICGVCQPNEGFQVICGVLRSAIYYVFDCSKDCAVCNNNTVLPFGVCTTIGGKTLKIDDPTNTHTVRFQRFESSPNCQGPNTTMTYASGNVCLRGTELKCQSGSGTDGVLRGSSSLSLNKKDEVEMKKLPRKVGLRRL